MSEFTITVDRREAGTKLGMSLAVPLMRVDEVNEGLIQAWNNANPSKQVKVGDVIVKVNGSKDNIQEALGKAEMLDITLTRGGEIDIDEEPLPPKKKSKEWYEDFDTFFPILVVLGIVISMLASFYLHR